MRSRYRFYTCPEPNCAKLAHKPDIECPDHKVTMTETIMQPVIRKTEQDPKVAADRMREAADKVGQAAGKPPIDPFNIAGIFEGMADDIRHGRRRFTDEELDRDDEDDEDESA